jgi:glycosyltransferase involved in cell wall biosynthesis
MAKYSICTTCYNSEEIVDEFLEPLLKLGNEYEIVVVDGGSTDNTFEKLEKYKNRIKLIEKKCNIGTGREIALENASGEIIINLDFDVQINNIELIIKDFVTNFNNKIIRYLIPNASCTHTIYVGYKNDFVKVGGFPNISFADDVYLDKKLKGLNFLIYREFEIQHKCLKIRNHGSGQTSRYENNFLKKVKRRILITRDNIFVKNYNFNDLIEFYKLKGCKLFLEGFPLYIIGKFLTIFIKVPKVEDEIERLKKQLD